ncbi:MAG: hypothetical protein WCK84_06495 [Bacteroidota bacterium]
MKNFLLALAVLIVISFSPVGMASYGSELVNPGIQHPQPPPKPKAPKKVSKPKEPKKVSKPKEPKKPKPAKKPKTPPKPPWVK